jgi:hypothetical protein
MKFDAQNLTAPQLSHAENPFPFKKLGLRTGKLLEPVIWDVHHAV